MGRLVRRARGEQIAIRLLEGLLAIDSRCIDAWGHIGLVAFERPGAGPRDQAVRDWRPSELRVASGRGERSRFGARTQVEGGFAPHGQADPRKADGHHHGSCRKDVWIGVTLDPR